MTPWLRWVALQAALAQATMVAIRVMAGYRALDFEAGPAGLGLIASAFAIPALLAAIPVGRAADRFGGAAVSAVGIALNLAGVAAALLAPSFAGLVMACGVSGLGHVAVLVGQQLFVAQHVADRDSDSAFGMLTAASSVGQLIAPPVVGLALTVPLAGIQRSTSGLAVALAFALLSAVGILALLRTDRRRRARGSSEQPPASDRPAVRGRWRAVLVSGIVLAAIDLLYSFLPLWASDNGVSPLQVGILLSIRAAIGVVSRIGLGRLVTRFGRKLLIVVAVSLGGVGFAALTPLG